MVSFLILADGTIVYDEYSTPIRWSRVTLVHTTRIAWCCLFSYFIRELRRGGLWACPQLSSYSWWGCEYNMYRCWQNYTFNLLVRSWCIWAILLSAMVFSRASRRCFSLNLSVGSLTWLNLRFTGCVVKRHCSWRISILQCARQFLIGLGTSTHVCHNQFWLLYHQAAC
jgi:hypothetical protein